MSAVPAALAKAFGQLADRAVVAVAIKSIAITLALFSGLGAGLYFAFASIAQRLGQDGGWGAVFALLLLPVAVWLLFRVVAIAVLQFFADEIVAAVEARYYPALAAQAKPVPFHRDLANSLRGLRRALGYNLLALPVAGLVMFTTIGPALVFLAVNAVLLGRELTDLPWLRHRTAGVHAQPPVASGQRLILGAAVTALMFVPVVNLLAPVIGAAAGTHLYHLTRSEKAMRKPFALLLAGLLAGCVGAPPVQQQVSRPVTHLPTSPPPQVPSTAAERPGAAFIAPQIMRLPGLEGVIGASATDLQRRFGTARLDLLEGDARKLQFSGEACVLDIYLYPLQPGAQPSATHVEARRASDGQAVDRAACVRALAGK